MLTVDAGMRSGIMAPMYVDLSTWEAANLPSVALLSVVILFVLAITLLALCTSCQRQSFTLEKSNTPTYSAETNSSTLVRVVKPGTETETPTPERNLSVLPEDLQLGPNQQFKAWRSHTLEKNTHTAMNGGMVTM
ncbi:uncharacterized protein si:ch73-204p21.2 isoform X1 [Silurus meridionalis]|uniref:uncharacterized protein si:ch73-204p21.2 isoform X1 n=1 Tax=Silurus meridionalis TaxID=175797 RepID=UPI001EEA8270|nr:uncharacterized protein si:ch73-204p21.2 isoform X1 [Silurus meridionalis]